MNSHFTNAAISLLLVIGLNGCVGYDDDPDVALEELLDEDVGTTEQALGNDAWLGDISGNGYLSFLDVAYMSSASQFSCIDKIKGDVVGPGRYANGLDQSVLEDAVQASAGSAYFSGSNVNAGNYDRIAGDADGNHRVDARYVQGEWKGDMAAMRDHVLGKITLSNPRRADINCDGNVSTIDLVLLRKCWLNKISSLPNCIPPL